MDFDIFTFELGDHDNPHPSAEQATLSQQPMTIEPSPLLLSPLDHHKDTQFVGDIHCASNDLDPLADLDVPLWTEAADSIWPDLTGYIPDWPCEPQIFDFHAQDEVGHAPPNTERCPVDVLSTECTAPLLSPPDPDEITQPQACVTTGLETPDSTPESITQAGDDRKSKRTYISPAAKAIFEEELLSNPYPNFGRVCDLASQTGVRYSTVKNWFSNNRHRRPIIKGKIYVSCPR
jgi:hypothetical protein